MCNEWQRKVVLRLGRFAGVRPGIFFLLPFVETTPFTMDLRVSTNTFTAEQTLTKDGASVTVDSIVYWRIVDAGLAGDPGHQLHHRRDGRAQALRDIIGRNDLGTLLSSAELDLAADGDPGRADGAGGSRWSRCSCRTSRCRTTCKTPSLGWPR